jgi:hypothetical protein
MRTARGALINLMITAACASSVACDEDLEGGAGRVMGEVAGEVAGELLTSGAQAGGQPAGDSLAGGAPAGERPAGAEALSACAPSAEQWPPLAPLLEARCGECHGASPQFGAPFPLASLSDFTPERALLAAEALSRGAMPPAGQPPLTAEERASLLSWLTCGAQGEAPPVSPPGGFESTRPVLSAPEAPPPGVDFFELRAGGFHVPPDRSDHYECFTLRAPLTEERFIRRIETLIDDARVLHHAVLIPEDGGRAPNTHSPCGDDNPFALIYGWAPGQGALHFPEGGIRLAPGQALTLQIHYNNRAGYADAIDNSGVRIYHAPPEGPEVAVITLGPMEFEVPPRSRGEAVGYCELPAHTRLVASFPHMHERGVRFEQQVSRDWRARPVGEEAWEDMITISGWDFESQYVYDTPMDLNEGDLIKTTCVYENTGDEPLSFGEKTEDEMCFNFAYISPPIGYTLCNQSQMPARAYVPGACAPEEASAWVPPEVALRLVAEAPPPPTQSVLLPAGRYWIDAALAYVDPTLAAQYRFDLERSGARAQGAVLWGESGEVLIDASSDLRVVAAGLSFTTRLELSALSAVSFHELPPDDPAAGSLSLTPSCGELTRDPVWLTLDDQALSAEGVGRGEGGAWLRLPLELGPVSLTLRLHLTAAP